MCVYTCTLHSQIHTYTHIYTYQYTYKYTHIHLHRYIHTYTNVRNAAIRMKPARRSAYLCHWGGLDWRGIENRWIQKVGSVEQVKNGARVGVSQTERFYGYVEIWGCNNLGVCTCTYVLFDVELYVCICSRDKLHVSMYMYVYVNIGM